MYFLCDDATILCQEKARCVDPEAGRLAEPTTSGFPLVFLCFSGVENLKLKVETTSHGTIKPISRPA